MAFKGDVKFGQSILHAPEEWLKRQLLPCVPRWLETYHLTLMTVLWSALIPVFSFFARAHIVWLWAVSLMIALQYITDLLDGAIGRQRNTGLVKWGYYMDHFLDFVFLCAILIGYAILLPQAYRTELLFIMAMFAGYMVNSFLSFACTNKFQIAYLGIGPTEIRLVFIAVNTLITCCGKTHMITYLPYVLAVSTFGLFVTVYRTGKELWRLDMHNKNNPPPAP